MTIYSIIELVSSEYKASHLEAYDSIEELLDATEQQLTSCPFPIPVIAYSSRAILDYLLNPSKTARQDAFFTITILPPNTRLEFDALYDLFLLAVFANNASEGSQYKARIADCLIQTIAQSTR